MKMIAKDFPLLSKKNKDKPFIYFDNAATTQKPQVVLDALMDFYTTYNAPIYRGVYGLAEQATSLYDNARETVARFIGAHNSTEIVFTSGATESINTVVASWAAAHIRRGDTIILAESEHHANLLPWQQYANAVGAQLCYIPTLTDGTLDMVAYSQLINEKTKLVAVAQVSNVFGVHHDIETIIHKAHGVGAKVLIDAAQSAPHQRINVGQMQADFLVFSGHKMLGPTGIGVLYINESLHDQLVPYKFGGSMVYEASLHTASWQKMPHLLQAGTPAVAQAIGLAAAINYLEKLDFKALQAHEAQLCGQLIGGLSQFDRVTILGPIEQLKEKGHLVSFVVDGMHAHDVAAYLDTYGICVRAGHHCAQPFATLMGIESSVRVSFYGYNTAQEVAYFIKIVGEML